MGARYISCPCGCIGRIRLMPSRFYVRLATLLVTVILCVAMFFSWRADQRDRAQLAQTLAVLATEKRTIVTPAQIVRELPSQISLPAPIVLQSTTPALPDSPTPKPIAVIPSEDLKPLYDFALDCKACQAKLSAAQGDLTDERKKTAALTHERDDALRIARGGSAWRRIGRAAKWFLIGATAGAAAAKAAH